MIAAFAKKIFVLFSMLLICSAHSSAQDTKDKLDKLMEYFETNEHFNGSVLVARKGSILLSKGYGYQNAEKKIKNTENTLFQIGTNTMQFTAELMLLIDAQGKLSLDDNVSKYLPDYPNGDKITIKNLLTQTAGVYDYTKDAAWMSHADLPVRRDTLIGRFRNVPLSSEPGEKFDFSYSNYVLLGQIAEKILDRTYEWLVKQRIYNQCGMARSGFDFTNTVDDNKAVGYNFPVKDAYVVAPVVDSSISFAAAGMFSTVGDLYKWHKTLQEHKLLPKNWQEIGYTPYKSHYAFGWEVATRFQKRFLENQGNISGFSSYIMRQENDDVFVVLLENTMQPADDNKLIADNIIKCLYEKDYKIPSSKQLLAEKEKIDTKTEAAEVAEAKAEARAEVVEKPAKKVKKVVAEKDDILKAYDGEYVFEPAFSIFVKHEGDDVFARATADDFFHLIPIKNTLYYKAGVDSKIEFVKDENGKVSRMVLHQHGRDLQGTKN